MAQFTDQTVTADVFELHAIVGTGSVSIDGISFVLTNLTPLLFNGARLNDVTMIIPATALVIGYQIS